MPKLLKRLEKSLISTDGNDIPLVSCARICPACGEEDSHVFDVRTDEKTDLVYRRRECRVCGNRWVTYEVLGGELENLLKEVRRNA